MRVLCCLINPLVKGCSFRQYWSSVSSNCAKEKFSWEKWLYGQTEAACCCPRTMGTTPGPPHLNPAGSTTQPLTAPTSEVQLIWKTACPWMQCPAAQAWATGSPGVSSVASFCCRAVLFTWKLAQQSVTKPVPGCLLKSNEVWELLQHTTEDVKLSLSQYQET